MKKTLFPKTRLYGNSQIISGIISLLLFLGTITYLNFMGLTKNPSWLEKNSLSLTTPIPTTSLAVSTFETINLASNSLLYSKDNLLISYSLWEGSSRNIATISGLIHELGKLDNESLFMLVGQNQDSYDSIYYQQGNKLVKTQLPSISISNIKPELTTDAKYIYYVANAGSGRKVIIRHEISSGIGQEMVESSLVFNKMALNKRNTMLGLIVEMANAVETQNYVLGIVQLGAKNLNLYPNVEILADSPILFNETDNLMLFNSIRGVSVFDLKTGKIIQTLIGNYLVDYQNQDQFFLTNKKAASGNCRSGLSQLYGYTQIESYWLKDKSLVKDLSDNLSFMANQNSLFTDPVKISGGNTNWFINGMDNISCQNFIYFIDQSQNITQKIEIGDLFQKSFVYIP